MSRYSFQSRSREGQRPAPGRCRRTPCRRERHAVIRAYLDDSADPTRSKYVAIGGILTPTVNVGRFGRLDGWDTVELQWLSATSALVAPFRSTDCETGNGQFKSWDRKDRDALFRDLVTIIEKSPLIGMAIVIPVSEFRDTFPTLVHEYDPYYFAVDYLIAALANFGVKKGQNVHLTFEDSDATSGRIRSHYSRLRSLHGWAGARALGGIEFGGKRLLQLQAADLLAREAFKHFDNLETERAMRKPLQRLLGNLTLLCATPQLLRTVRDDLNWPADILELARQAEIR